MKTYLQKTSKSIQKAMNHYLKIAIALVYNLAQSTKNTHKLQNELKYV